MCVLKPGRALSRMQILFVCSTLSKQCARVSRRVGKVLAARCALAGASDGPYHLRWTDSSGRGDTVHRVSWYTGLETLWTVSPRPDESVHRR